MTPIVLLAIANLIILILVIMNMSDQRKTQAMLQSVMMITYSQLRKEGKTTGDIINDIIEVANEMAKTEDPLF